MFEINHDEVMEKLMETARNEDFNQYSGNIYDDDFDAKLIQTMVNCIDEQKQKYLEQQSAS